MLQKLQNLSLFCRDGWQLHRKHFAIFVTQAKCNVIIIRTNGFDFFEIIKYFLMRYYRSLLVIIFLQNFW